MKLTKPVTFALSLSLMTLSASAACCYFAALNQDVQQPGQRAFITWDEANQTEAFTVQPQFSGNAAEFGMVIPTPNRPKLQEMPKDFFKALAVFTILEPMDTNKFRCPNLAICESSSAKSDRVPAPPVRVLEGGVVGNLDYKILEADKADALYEWLKTNHYHYGGDESTLNFYVSKKWNFTVMKVDPRQMKQKTGGKYQGEITPTRFTFKTPKAIYPLRITQISVKDRTDVLLYVMAKKKMDMDGSWSYETNFVNLWTQAMQFAVPEKLTAREKYWQKKLANSKAPSPNGKYFPRGGISTQGANLEWAGKLTAARLDVLTGKAKYNRDAPPEEVKKLRLLTGHLKQDWYLTKFRRNFQHSEMNQDISLIPARIQGENDDIEYVSILSSSPP